MYREAEISLPTITTKQSPLLSQKRSTYLIKHAGERKEDEERRRRRKRGKSNHCQSPLKIPWETETIWVIKPDLSRFFSSMVHVVSPVQRMPRADAWSWGLRPGFPGPQPAAARQLWKRGADAPPHRRST